MNAEQWKEINQLFHQALEHADSEREDFIEKSASNSLIKKEVYALLKSHSQAHSELFRPAIPPSVHQKMPQLPVEPPYPLGTTVDDFKLLRVLGSGGFATVYLAHQHSLDRQVALKVSPDFGEEAKTMAKLSHPHIVSVYSQTVDPSKKRRLVCMQYVPGPTLAQLLELLGKQPATPLNGSSLLSAIAQLSPHAPVLEASALKDREKLAGMDFVEAVLWMGARLSNALAYAHDQGVLHLDVKPSNILIDPYGRPSLTDFNVSVRTQRQGSSDAHNLLGGTYHYMAPEHRHAFEHKNQTVDGRADIYSLGQVLIECFQSVPNAPTLHTLPNPIQQESSSQEKVSTKGVPNSELELILSRSVHPDPSERFPNAKSMVQALEGSLELRQISTHMPAPGKLTRLGLRLPFATLILLALFPQVLGSAVNISYNAFRIVSTLTPTQQNYFHQLCIQYNSVVYPIATALFVALVLPIRRFLKKSTFHTEDLQSLRRRVLSLPKLLVGITSVGWLPGAFFFPWALNNYEEPITKDIFQHFYISFFLSWLVALTYSYISTQFVSLRILYPRLWVGCGDIQKTARKELEGTLAHLRSFQLLASVGPLIATLCIVLSEPQGISGIQHFSFQVLVSLLVGSAMFGGLFSLKTAYVLHQTYFALSGKSAPTVYSARQTADRN